MTVKRKIVTIGTICFFSMLLCACGSVEKTEVPTITGKPKVLVVDAATPTPTLTLEEGELTLPTETPLPTQEPTQAPTATPKPTPAPVSTQTPAPTKEPTPTPEPTKAEILSYEKGVLTDTGFKSEWMGIQFLAEEDIEVLPQEELDETMRLMQESLIGETGGEVLDYEALPMVYEMETVWQDKGLIMQVMVEYLADASVTEADYMEKLREEMYMFEESGFTYTVDDKKYSEVIAGKEFSNFGYTVYLTDEDRLHQENYFKKQGNRMILISIMGESEDGMQELLEMFEAY